METLPYNVIARPKAEGTYEYNRSDQGHKSQITAVGATSSLSLVGTQATAWGETREGRPSARCNVHLGVTK